MSDTPRKSERMHFSEWMSDADANMWHIEADPQLRSTIVSAWLLDRMPELDRFDELLSRSIDRIPRLRQRVVEDAFQIAPPRWEEDPHFDPAYHVRHAHLGGDAELEDLLALAEPIAMQAFDKDRPLWEFHLVDGLSGGRAGVIMKLHHAITDGVGMMKMTESLVERTRERKPRRERTPTPRISAEERPTGESLRDAVTERTRINVDRTTRAARALFSGMRRFLSEPVEVLRDAGETVSSIARLLRPVSEPMSPIMRKRGTSLRLRSFEVPLETMKRAGKIVDGTVNDAFVSAMAAGFRLYHEHHGKPVDELRMTMPINLREGDQGNHAGNQFAPARFEVPVGIENALERTRVIQERVKAQRAERALPLTNDVTGLMDRLPHAATRALVGSMIKAIDFVTSNVPGPRFTVYTGGAKIERMIPFGPPAGAAVNITLFSYDGICNVGVNIDPAAVPDPDLLVECLEKGLEEIVAVP